MLVSGGQPNARHGDVEARLQKLRVQEVKTLLNECMLPLTGTKAVLLERLNKFYDHVTPPEKTGTFRLLHDEDSYENAKKASHFAPALGASHSHICRRG
mmetsp:Transcript_14697/g.37558  ORF Transcript_14697/g.37558 Transcript_14697/m.37558 type:complete len:99 (-) Transcript_14697:1-297(-)